ncbi:flagellar basal body rod protein FlgC [Hippea alviniae]|uniref:flagellar basal body rod protein FlgC n=1 Tax=Hippea alviniae TaxID=1279027 RepID=UPI0003B37F2C|nr:flagellar basal body rod protein FlgC [Hippea alviniae]
MSVFDSLNIASSGMSAQRLRMNIISANIANADSVKTKEGGPYKRRDVVFEAVNYDKFGDVLKEVKVADIVRDDTPPKLVYDPSNPLANKDGYVAYPNINPVVEMVNLIDAMRTYQANASVIDSAKQMVQSALSVLRA